MNTRIRRVVAAVSALVIAIVTVAVFPSAAMAYSPWNNGYTHDELMLLARVVYAEADGEPYVGKVAVAAVVLNRVRSPLFPDTIEGVVYEPWQFSCVRNWMFNSYPSQDSIRAAEDALAGWDPTYGALYYFNYHIVSNSWLWAKPLAVTLGNHRFTH
jgi:N-acetylmuramoyl-L-alanine amidase